MSFPSKGKAAFFRNDIVVSYSFEIRASSCLIDCLFSNYFAIIIFFSVVLVHPWPEFERN